MATYKDFNSDSLNNVVVDKKAIEQSIFNILTTRKGSLAGKPEFVICMPICLKWLTISPSIVCKPKLQDV